MLYDSGSSNSTFCDNLEGGDEGGAGRRFRMEGTHIHLWLTHVDIWQKLTQCCKAIILQLKISD